MSGLPQVNIPTDPTADEDHAGLALAATLRAVADDVERRIKVVPGRYSDEWITERPPSADRRPRCLGSPAGNRPPGRKEPIAMTDKGRQDKAFLPAPELTQEAFPPLPLCWPALTEQERAEQLEALNDWTRWLAHCYALDHRTVPPC